MLQEFLDYAPEIQVALEQGAPVVALESTLITHGLPYPLNLETARSMETEVRRGGAVPATIAVIKGRIKVGLSEEQMHYLATAEPGKVRKCSRRDFSIAIGMQQDGATTVAGTMIVAQAAGISVFATGGIGGVHRDHPFDVSADLIELGRTSVAVVCSGAKSILDLPLTLEVLETQGVPVVGLGTSEVPAFYSRSSGLPVDVSVASAYEAARIIAANQASGIGAGILIAVPVPAEDELPAAEAEAGIQQALAEAHQQGISGKDVTPFLLSKVVERTAGASLKANRSLLSNNAYVAGTIAVELVRLQKG